MGLTEIIIWSGTHTQHILLMAGSLDSSRISTLDSSHESPPCWNTSAVHICTKRKTKIMFVCPLLKLLARWMAKEVQTKFPNATMLAWQWWVSKIAVFVMFCSSNCRPTNLCLSVCMYVGYRQTYHLLHTHITMCSIGGEDSDLWLNLAHTWAFSGDLLRKQTNK